RTSRAPSAAPGSRPRGQSAEGLARRVQRFWSSAERPMALSCVGGRGFLLARREVAGQEQGCCGAASDLPEFVRVQPALAEIAEVVAEFLVAAVGVVGAEQQAVGTEGVAGAGEGVG